MAAALRYSKYSLLPWILLCRVFLGKLTRGKEEVEAVYNEKEEGGSSCYGGWGWENTLLL